MDLAADGGATEVDDRAPRPPEVQLGTAMDLAAVAGADPVVRGVDRVGIGEMTPGTRAASIAGAQPPPLPHWLREP